MSDYEMEPYVRADTPVQIRAAVDPVRSQVLALVLERAASVNELAAALKIPRSRVSYHVTALVDVGLLRVVRTRKVRAVEERFYGRTGRTIILGNELPSEIRRNHFLTEALTELVEDEDAFESTIRYARIPPSRALEFFERVAALAEEFADLPAEGDVICGVVAATFKTARPVLPPSEAS